MRAVHIVGPFDGVLIRTILANTIEQAAARAESFCDHFAAAQNENRSAGNKVSIALDVYIAVLGGEKIWDEYTLGGWVDVAAKAAGFVLYQYRFMPGQFEERRFKRVPEVQEVIGL